MRCCEDCFVNETLRKYIHNNGNGIIGDCDFCGSIGVFTIKANDLHIIFANLLELFEPVEYAEHYSPGLDMNADDVGENLAQAIQDDWGDIFNFDKLDIYKQCELLDEIREGSDFFDYKDIMVPSNDLWISTDKRLYHVSQEEIWEDFCQFIKHKRRFILENKNYLDNNPDPRGWLSAHIPKLENVFLTNTPFFRARINPRDSRNKPLNKKNMGAPPHEVAISGRVNPIGIPVLYGALEKKTAVAEVRPEKGAIVTIATLKAKQSLHLVDLTITPQILNPFGFEIGKLVPAINRNEFLHCLNTTLSIPIRRDDTDIDYIPTQYVAEFIKSEGYDGILYKSSLSESGKNIVIFNPELIKINKTELVEVTCISIQFENHNPK